VKLIYSRGYPFGAPVLYLRGGATRDTGVQAMIRDRGGRWDPGAHAWTLYMHTEEASAFLSDIRDARAVEIHPKDDLSAHLVLTLRDPLESGCQCGDDCVSVPTDCCVSAPECAIAVGYEPDGSVAVVCCKPGHGCEVGTYHESRWCAACPS